jgi:hypothetical protein
MDKGYDIFPFGKFLLTSFKGKSSLINYLGFFSMSTYKEENAQILSLIQL